MSQYLNLVVIGGVLTMVFTDGFTDGDYCIGGWGGEEETEASYYSQAREHEIPGVAIIQPHHLPLGCDHKKRRHRLGAVSMGNPRHDSVLPTLHHLAAPRRGENMHSVGSGREYGPQWRLFEIGCAVPAFPCI